MVSKPPGLCVIFTLISINIEIECIGNCFLNRRYCTSNLVIALLQIAAEVTSFI